MKELEKASRLEEAAACSVEIVFPWLVAGVAK
jgi:hypothetical protein